jgi:hypothetical protein
MRFARHVAPASKPKHSTCHIGCNKRSRIVCAKGAFDRPNRRHAIDQEPRCLALGSQARVVTRPNRRLMVGLDSGSHGDRNCIGQMYYRHRLRYRSKLRVARFLASSSRKLLQTSVLQVRNRSTGEFHVLSQDDTRFQAPCTEAKTSSQTAVRRRHARQSPRSKAHIGSASFGCRERLTGQHHSRRWPLN